MTDHLTTLANKAASYRRGGNHLLKAIDQIEDILVKCFGDYQQFRFTHEHIAFVVNLECSNVGEYGPALCYVSNRDRLKPMPETWREAGGSYYLHSDFSVTINDATRSEIWKVAKALPAFLEALATFLGDKAAENEEKAASLERIADAIKKALDEAEAVEEALDAELDQALYEHMNGKNEEKIEREEEGTGMRMFWDEATRKWTVVYEKLDPVYPQNAGQTIRKAFQSKQKAVDFYQDIAESALTGGSVT